MLEASQGESAIALSREHTSPIDLVLCDVVMPGLSGPDVAKLLQLDRPGLKIVYVTGYADRTTYLGNGLGSHVLAKPFTPDTLFRIVRQVLDEDIKSCA